MMLPIFSKTACGYGFHQLIDLLMTSKVDSSKVCTVRPSGVSENATFIVDLDCIRFGDLKSDDLDPGILLEPSQHFFE